MESAKVPNGSPYGDIMTQLDGGERIRTLTLYPGDHDDPIKVSLQPVFLNDYPEYEALSYVWGIELSDNTVNVDGYDLKVTQNLDIALRHLRFDSEPRVLWIDALCINQGSIEERTHQVRLMRQVYTQATWVYIWLGPVENGSDEVMQACVDETELDDRGYVFLVDAALILLQRPWFFRVWCVQEAVLNWESTIIACGKFSTPLPSFSAWFFREFHPSREILNLSTDPIPGDNTAWIEGIQQSIEQGLGGIDNLFKSEDPSSKEIVLQRNIDRLKEHYRDEFLYLVSNLVGLESARSSDEPTFSSTFFRTANRNATDLRDKSFGIFGLCGHWYEGTDSYHKLRPDYSKSLGQVFAEMASILLSEISIDLYTTWKLQTTFLQEPNDIPSWVPDLSRVTFPRGTPASYLDHFCDFPRELDEWLKASKPKENPWVKVSQDSRVLRAAGKKMGCIKSVYDFDIPEDATVDAQLDHAYRFSIFLDEHNVPLEKGVSVLSETDYCVSKAYPESLFDVVFRRGYATLKDEEEKSEWASYCKDKFSCYKFIVLDDGVIGATSGDPQEGDSVVGLFGADLPFLLRERAEGGWKMINAIRIDGHEIKKEVTPLSEGDTFEDFPKYGFDEFFIY